MREGQMPICIRCFKEKPEEEFAWRWKLLGIRQRVCRECRKRENDLWYRKHKQAHMEKVKARKNENRSSARDFVWDYLMAHPCEICGERDPTVLEFHQLYGKDKAISLMIAEGATIKKIEKEIAKCQVLCCNCHRRITSREQGWFRK
jgi:hypothetical protein